MKNLVSIYSGFDVEIISGVITQVEKVGGSSIYTTIYAEDTFFRVHGDVPCQIGWNVDAVIFKRYKSEPDVYWYQFNGGERVFYHKQFNYYSVDQMIDEYYGEKYNYKTKKPLWQFLSVVLGVLLFAGLKIITKKILIPLVAAVVVTGVLEIVFGVKKDFSLKKGNKWLYDLLNNLATNNIENLLKWNKDKNQEAETKE